MPSWSTVIIMHSTPPYYIQAPRIITNRINNTKIIAEEDT